MLRTATFQLDDDCFEMVVASHPALLDRCGRRTLGSSLNPVAGAGMPGVQRLQFLLSESPWEAEQVNDRRLELPCEQPATAPHDGGVIVIDDSGDRKDGTATAHVGRQRLGRYGKTCRSPRYGSPLLPRCRLSADGAPDSSTHGQQRRSRSGQYLSTAHIGEDIHCSTEDLTPSIWEFEESQSLDQKREIDISAEMNLLTSCDLCMGSRFSGRVDKVLENDEF
ncbi:transposase [Streptomyces sp. NPDC048441]|uniref:transposase n=1 Tax=Streptomyces sp. NPDC048441 TaxID=3365552 RepID=UPI003717FC15